MKQRMNELMLPINRQIMMCDDHKDLLMLASCMMVSAKDIFDDHLGPENRKKMFKDFSE